MTAQANSRMFFIKFACRAVFASLFTVSIIFFILYGDDFLSLRHPGFVAIDSPALVTKDAAGNMYIADSARRRVIRAGADGKADLLMVPERHHFSQVYGLAVDAAGDIFILNTIRDDRTRRVISEVVQRHQPDGRFLEEIFREDHEIPTSGRRIAGLVRNAEGGVAYITLEDERFVLHSHTSNEKIETVYDFPMASVMFNSFDVGGGDLVLFTTRHGEIYKADDKGLSRIFASGASTPWDAAIGDDGVFYFTDLKRRGIYSIMPDGESEAVYGDPDTIYYRVSAKGGLAAISESSIIDLDAAERPVFEQIGAAGNIFAMRLCSWFAALILIAGCVWGIVLLARFLIKRNDFVIKFSAAFIVGVLFVTAVFSMIVTQDITSRMTREMNSRLTNVAKLVAMQIPSEAFLRLKSVTDYLSDDYALVSSPIQEIMSQAEYEEMYCVLYKILDGSIAEVFDSENNIGIVNYPYDWPLEGSDEMEILSTGQYKTYIHPSWVDGGVIFSLCPVYGNAGEPIGLIEIGTDLAAFQRENMNLILNIFLNVISISVATIIVVIELLVFVDGRRKMLPAADSFGAFRVPPEIMRSAVFLVYFITNISTSFLPIYARSLILDAGLSLPFPVEFLIAAPISADVLFGAVAAILGDRFVKKFGPRRMAITGAVFIVCGTCLAFMFYDLFALTAGFAVCGFGCGLILFLTNLQIAGECDPSEKDRGFAGTAAAVSSGINVGVVMGAFLTNWLSHQAVLGIAALAALIFPAFSYKYMAKIENTSSSQRLNDEKQEMSTVKFLLSPRVFTYFLALLGPAIVSGYFIIYLFPIVGFDFGISESNIGYAFLLNSLAVIFFSSMLTNICSKKLGKPLSLSLWTLIYAGSFAAFAYFRNIPALLSVLVLMGFADCFGQSLSTSYYTELPDVERYGCGRAIGISNVVENAAQTIGPFVFSYALHIGLTEGLFQIAGGLAVLSIIFFTSATRMSKRR